MVRPSASPASLYFLLLIAPLAVSPHPTLAKRGMSLASGPVSMSAASSVTPSATATATATATTTTTPESELSAIQGSDLDRADDARLQARAGTPITTFDDGLVLEVSSGVATNLPAQTTPPIQNAPNPPAQLQSQAVQNSSDPQATAAAQPSHADTNIVTTPAPTAPSTTAPALLPAAQGSTQVPTTLPSR